MNESGAGADGRSTPTECDYIPDPPPRSPCGVQRPHGVTERYPPPRPSDGAVAQRSCATNAGPRAQDRVMTDARCGVLLAVGPTHESAPSFRLGRARAHRGLL